MNKFFLYLLDVVHSRDDTLVQEENWGTQFFAPIFMTITIIICCGPQLRASLYMLRLLHALESFWCVCVFCVFFWLSQINELTYSALLGACGRAKKLARAFRIVQEMRDTGVCVCVCVYLVCMFVCACVWVRVSVGGVVWVA